MKNLASRLCATVGTISLLTISLAAVSAAAQGEPVTSQSASLTSAQPPAPSAPAKLPYGVEDVVKLSHAQVSEGVILTYIQNSGTIYNLGPKDIVYLRDQGVSDHVINAMLDQRKNVGEATAQTTQATAQSAPAYSDTSAAVAAPTYAAPEAYAQPAPTYA